MLNLDLVDALRPLGFTTRPTRRASRPARSAATSTRTPAARTASRTASPRAHVLALDVVLPDGAVAPARRRGARGRRLRPARRRRRLRGHARHRDAACVRLTPIAARGPHDAARLHDASRTAPRRSPTIIARGVVPAAVEMMDHGIVARGRGVRARRLPDRRRRDPARRGRRARRPASTRRRARSRPPRTRTACGTMRVAADDAERALLWKGRKSAFGAVAQIAPHYYLHDCVVPRTQARRGARRRLRDRRAPRPDRHERLPRRRRQPASADLVRPARARARWSACWRPARRSCACASTRAARSRGEHGIGLEKRDFMPLVFTRRGPRRAGVRARGVRSRRADEPAEGAARRRAVRRLRGGARRTTRAAAAALPEGSWI